MYHHNENNEKCAFPLSQPTLRQDYPPYSWPFEKNNNSNVMTFHGNTMISKFPPSTSGINNINLNMPSRVKRKNESSCDYFPSKQLITEEKLCNHLNGFHISNDFQAHSLSCDSFEESYNVNIPSQELDSRLKNAQKIIICDEVKKSLQKSNLYLQQNEIYKVLSNRIEKPCQALILWQPPQTLDRLITDFKSHRDERDDENEVKMSE